MRPSRIIKPGKRIGHLHVLSHILDGSGKAVGNANATAAGS